MKLSSKLACWMMAATFLAALPRPSAARAQTLPAWLQVRAADVSTVEPSYMAPAPALQRSARRGAYMIAVGTGLMAAGVASALIYGRKGFCSSSDVYRAPVLFGSITAVSGLGLLLSGAMRLKHLPPANKGARDGVFLPLTAASTGLAGFAVNTLLAAPQFVSCD